MGMELERCLAWHCAPVFYGRKSANLVSVEKKEEKELEQLLKETGVSWMVLCSCSRRSQILIYENTRLEAYLNQERNRAFLKQFGYGSWDVKEKLLFLAGRYGAYRKHGAEFPHEIGLFLEYPLEDIEGYIRHKGKNALHNGYWKVYHDADGAVERFRIYDGVREHLQGLLEMGYSLSHCITMAAS